MSTALERYAAERKAVLVDLRSDTLTRPTPRMRDAIQRAEVGDDVYGEDPTTNKLEEMSAKLVGMEAAIFLPSGTMGNLIAIMNHCNRRGCEAYCGEDSHVVLHEQGGASQLAGVTIRPQRNNPDGTFDLDRLAAKLRHGYAYEPISRLVLVENTFNGKVVPRDWLRLVVEFCRERDLRLHMDGARLWNASVASGMSPREIVDGFDSVVFCLSKGLGAPVGSVLCGSKEFVAQARRARKVLGGGMRQAGILAAAGIVALQESVSTLSEDHRRARTIARAINDLRSPRFYVDLDGIQTNMVIVEVRGNDDDDDDDVTGQVFVDRLKTVVDDVEDDRVVLASLSLARNAVRLVLYYDIDDDLMNAAIRKISHVIRSFDDASNRAR